MTDAEPLGPVDYLIVEWPADSPPTGEAIPALLDLVDRGLVRILDIAFLAKGEDGTVALLNLNDLGEDFAVFDGASSGLVGDDDIAEAANALEPGATAALLVWENRWAAPFAAKLREGGAQLVASGRIPVQAILEALEATEA